MKITVDFKKITGKIKAMHAIGQPPLIGTSDRFMHYLKDAGIPYSRLHDVGGAYGQNRFVDIPNIFRNFDADENDPASYDFSFTDALLEMLICQGCEPYFRFGVSIENSYHIQAYNIYPPKDFKKWAIICEHIIRHYNEGWANGYHYNITYWEIWNEPEGNQFGQGNPMWLGTAEEYYRLYEITANHLKNCFGNSIKVGGYASCGFYSYKKDTDLTGIQNPTDDRDYFINYLHDFLKYISSDEHKSPLDFFSWHSYMHGVDFIKTVGEHSDYLRKVLDKYGFKDVEDHLNEWNPTLSIGLRGGYVSASHTLATMLMMQKKSTHLLAYYDARIGTSVYSGMFNPDSWMPYLTYYTFVMFNEAYKLKNEVYTSSDNENVYVLGAADDNKKVIIITNVTEHSQEIEFDIRGGTLENAKFSVIDEFTDFRPTSNVYNNGKLKIANNVCVLIEM